MQNNIVRQKVIRPLLKRKNEVITHTSVRILSSNNQTIIIKPQQQQPLLKPQPPQSPAKQAQQPPRAPRSQLIDKPNKRKAEVKYSTRDITQNSLDKINKLANVGKDRILIIVGNGPSILEVPLQKLRNISNIDMLSINKPDTRLWPTQYWAFFDRSQLKRHEDLWSSYEGTLLNSTSIKEQKTNSMQFKNLGGNGFSKNMAKGLYIGRSSVYASMQIAYWMNYSKIFIFGCDMAPEGINGMLHFYGVNPDVDPKLRAQRFANEAESYNVAATVLNDNERMRYYFCSDYNKWPFVDKFNRLAQSESIDYILNMSNNR